MASIGKKAGGGGLPPGLGDERGKPLTMGSLALFEFWRKNCRDSFNRG